MGYDYKLDDAIMQLHNIARLVEQRIGQGALAEDLRRLADRINTIVVAEIK